MAQKLKLYKKLCFSLYDHLSPTDMVSSPHSQFWYGQITEGRGFYSLHGEGGSDNGNQKKGVNLGKKILYYKNVFTFTHIF